MIFYPSGPQIFDWWYPNRVTTKQNNSSIFFVTFTEIQLNGAPTSDKSADLLAKTSAADSNMQTSPQRGDQQQQQQQQLHSQLLHQQLPDVAASAAARASVTAASPPHQPQQQQQPPKAKLASPAAAAAPEAPTTQQVWPLTQHSSNSYLILHNFDNYQKCFGKWPI